MSLAISAPLIGAATVALKSAGDFEQSMNQLQAVSGATADQMAGLQAQALQLGADTSFSAGEAAQGMLELAKAGMSAKETGAAIGGVMSLAAAGNLDLAQAAEITANALNAFNLPAADSGRVADILAAAANSSSVEVTDMAQSFNMASAVFSSSGQSIDDLSTSIAILGNNGLKGSDAGTSLKTMMMRLTAPTKEAKKLMNELGINIYDAEGKTRAFPDILADLQQAMTGVNEVTVTSGGRTKEQTAQMKHYAAVIKQTQQKLLDYQTGVAGVAQSEDAKKVSIDRLNRTLAAAQAAYGELAGIQGTSSTVMKQMTEEERNQALAMIFGSDAVRAANILIREGTDEYGKMKDAVTEQGAAAQVADARMKGFNGAIEYIKGSIDSFLISTALPFLDSFGGIIRKVGDTITAFGALPVPVKNAALAFLAVMAAAGPVAMALRGIMAVVGALLSPLGMITLAVAVMAAAWAGDWGGIQEKTFAAIEFLRPYFGELLSWINAAAHGDWGPLKAGLQGALNTVTATIQAFKWSDFVTKLQDWAVYIGQLAWSGFITALDWLGVLPTLTSWSEYLSKLTWTDVITALTDWGTYITGLDWATILPVPVWNAYVTVLSWANIIKALDWPTFVAIMSSWADYIAALPWADYVATLTSWGTYITNLAWSTVLPVLTSWATYISSLPWGTYVATLTSWSSYIATLSWSAFVTTLTSWGNYITSLPWGTYVATLTSWGNYIAALSWSAILPVMTSWATYITSLDWKAVIPTAVDWAMWIPALGWAAFITSLAWSAYAVVLAWNKFISLLTWNNFVTALDWAVWLVKMAWSAYVTAVDWAAWIAGLSWSSFVAHLRWMDFAAKMNGWGDFIPPLTWDSFVDKVNLSDYIPDFGSWYDYIKAYFGGAEAAAATGNAGGTSYAYGQRSAINERGRELISIPADQTILPPGSRVYTNGQSNRMLDADTGTGLTINFYGTVVQNDMDIHRLANKLGSLVRKQRP
jgi:TP901 family phage tail tape measure protein